MPDNNPKEPTPTPSTNPLVRLKEAIKDRIYTAVGELAWHAGCVMAEAFESQGEEITIREMEAQDKAEAQELGVSLGVSSPVKGGKAN